MCDKLNTESKNHGWYAELCEEGQYIYDLVYKYHQYFSKQDKKYRCIVRILRLLILAFSMVNTIVLGLKTVISMDQQIVIGLIISALITFTTAIVSYFNFEEYWVRNITIHIDLNILRDNFIFDAKAGNLANKENLKIYRQALEDLQKRNIDYWHKSLQKLDKV